MGRLSKELYNVQNPALGAYILAKFSLGYSSELDKGVPLPLTFIILPMIYKTEIMDVIYSTQRRSGLRNFAEKFVDNKLKKNDLLLQINGLSQRGKIMTLEAIRVGITAEIIAVENNGCILPLEDRIKSFKIYTTELNKMAKAAEKLGAWCSELSLLEISQVLKVRF